MKHHFYYSFSRGDVVIHGFGSRYYREDICLEGIMKENPGNSLVFVLEVYEGGAHENDNQF